MRSDRLKFYRNKAGLTQRELASLAGLSAPTINKIETYITENPLPRTLNMIAKALKVPVQKVFPVNILCFTKTELKKSLIGFFNSYDLEEKPRIEKLCNLFVTDLYGE